MIVLGVIMKKLSLILIFLISLLNLALAGAPKKSDGPQNSGNLKFFGFYASDMSGLDDVTEEIQSFVNITHVADPDIEAAFKKINRAKKLGLHVLYDISSCFFHPIKNSRKSWELYDDYENRWMDLYWPKLKPFVEDGTILAFYNLDEPFSKERLPGKKPQERAQILERVAKLVKDKFPLTPIALTLGGNSYDNYVLPKHHDWFGIDDYDCWDVCPGGVSVPDRYLRLMKKLNSDQFVYLIPDAWKWAKGKPSSEEQAQMLDLYKKYLLFAKKQPKVIGLLHFIYQDLDSFPGTRSAPLLRDFIKKIGSNFKAKVSKK